MAYYRGMLLGFNKRRSWLLTAGKYVKSREPELTTLSTVPSAAFGRADTGMVLAFPVTNGPAYVSQWDSANKALMSGTWRSMEFAMPGWWQPAAMKVVADYPREPRKVRKARRDLQTWRRHKGSSLEAFIRNHPGYADLEPFLAGTNCPVHVRIYCDGHLYYERSVYHDRPFRIPHDYYGINWSMEVETKVAVYEIQLENSIDSLTKIGEGVGNSRG